MERDSAAHVVGERRGRSRQPRVALWIVVTVAAGCVLRVESVRPRAAGCDPEGNIRFICDQRAPEDLVLVYARRSNRSRRWR